MVPIVAIALNADVFRDNANENIIKNIPAGPANFTNSIVPP